MGNALEPLLGGGELDDVEEKFGEQNFRALTLALGGGALAKIIL